MGLFAHTSDREWQANKTECSRAGARALRPLLGDARALGLIGAPPFLHPITSRKSARHTLALRLGPCSNRAIGLSKEDSGFQFQPRPLFAESLWVSCSASMALVAAAAAKALQSCPTLCDPRDSSPPGSPVPGILQARTLEWVAISFSNASK